MALAAGYIKPFDILNLSDLLGERFGVPPARASQGAAP
jgi:hypothetical protein